MEHFCTPVLSTSTCVIVDNDHLIINNQQKITINVKLKLATFSLISDGLSKKSPISFHVCYLLNCLFNSHKHLATYSYIQLNCFPPYIHICCKLCCKHWSASVEEL